MKKRLGITLLALACTVATSGITAAATMLFSPPASPVFTQNMVLRKTMISDKFPSGTMTFHNGGTLTCANYPSFIDCKRWYIDPDGRLRREFTDRHTGKVVEVTAYWKLLNQSGNSLNVEQTSSNSTGTTLVTVTIQ